MGLATRDQREVGHPGQSGGWREHHPGIPATRLHPKKTVAGAARRAQRVTAAAATARGLRKNRKDHVDGQSVAERTGGRYCAEDHAEVAAGELEREGVTPRLVQHCARRPHLSGIAAIKTWMAGTMTKVSHLQAGGDRRRDALKRVIYLRLSIST